MKVVFITNYMTHHQLPFCNEMYKRLGDDFLFIATNVMDGDRTGMGWEINNGAYPYIRQHEDGKYEDDINNCDVLLCGGTHHLYYDTRLNSGKLTFRYFERLYKTGQLKAFIPTSYKRNRLEHTAKLDKPVYLLCAGAYVPSDFNLLGAYKNKMYKWGYFPSFENYDINVILEKKKKNSILWTGRMIDWKLGINAVRAAKMLKDEGLQFTLTMIGDGDCRGDIERYIKAYGLEEYVTLLSFMKPEEVREKMKEASIYLMTSNMQEGWGAVVNEAMNSGCAVVASYGAGATPYLIEDNVNGLIYNYKSVDELAGYVKELLNNKEKTKELGREAYETIKNMWNPREAADRFLVLCESLLKGEQHYEAEGPLSEAKVISPGKGYSYCKGGK